MASAFDNLAPRVIADLVRDLGVTPEQAAGIVGNLGAESGLLAIQEKRPIAGRGGFGWAQWTGPRRVAFENWARSKGFSLESYEANYGFLVHDLRTSHASSLAKVRLTKTAKAAAETFGYWFERFLGYQNLNSANYRHRIKLAERALALYRAKHPAGPTPHIAPVEPPSMPPSAPPVVAQHDPVLPPKPWYQSRVIMGGIVGIALPFLARYVPGLTGVSVDAATNTIIQAVDLIAPLVGGFLVVQGRLSASRPISGTQAAEDVQQARYARESALQEARAEVPPGYVPESAAPVHEPWNASDAVSYRSVLAPGLSLEGLDDIPNAVQRVVGTAQAVAPVIMPVLTALVAAARALEQRERVEPDPQP